MRAGVIGVLLAVALAAAGCVHRQAPKAALQPRPGAVQPMAPTAEGPPPQPPVPPAEPLLPDTERWGGPPERGFDFDLSALPHFKGWFYYSTDSLDLITAGPRLLLVLRGSDKTEKLLALKRSNGQIAWQARTGGTFSREYVVVSDEFIMTTAPTYVVVGGELTMMTAPGMDQLPVVRLKDGTDALVDRGSAKQSRHWQVYSRGDKEPVVPSALERTWRALGFSVLRAERNRGQLIVRADGGLYGHDQMPEGDYIFVLPLGANGKPLPGRLKDPYVLPGCAEAVKGFLAMPSPLKDDELMTRLVGGGKNATDALLHKVPELDSAHLNALFALCVYPDSWRIWEERTWAARDALLDAVEHTARPLYTANVSRWLDETQDPDCRFRLIGMLALCGGPLAKERLAPLYAQHTYTVREQPRPPFDPYHWSTGTDNVSDTVQDRGRCYIAFACPDLASPESVFLGIDANADGRYEDVLFTGLCNTYRAQCFPVGHFGLDGPKGPLKLSVRGDRVTIAHHVPIAKRESDKWNRLHWSYELVGANYVTTALSLADLRRDSDRDGLPDMVEDSLLTDPRSADTDGDGLPDGQDPLPNVDQSQFTWLERGIQRALVYGNILNPNWATASPVQTPWDTRYYVCPDSPLRVAASLSPSGFGVSLADPKDEARYMELLKGANTWNLTRIHVVDLTTPQARAKGDPSDFGSAAYYANSPDTPPGTKYVIQFNYAGCGDQAFLVDVDGELFPAKYEMAWES